MTEGRGLDEVEVLNGRASRRRTTELANMQLASLALEMRVSE